MIFYRNILIILALVFSMQYSLLSQAVNFYAKKDFIAGDTPFWITSADLNGDNFSDIAVVNAGGSGNSVSVFLNTMIDYEPSFTSKTDFAVGGNPVSVTIADINLDNKNDIISANGNDNTVSVLINGTVNNSLTPSFSAKYDFGTGNRPVSVVIADINQDSKPDLVTANYYANSISVLLNTTEAGSSIPSFDAKSDYDIGSNPIELIISDLNNDNMPDITVGNINVNTVSVFINLTPANAAKPVLAEKTDLITGYNPTSVSSTDINNDSKPDIVTSNFAGQSVSVLINNTPDGAGTPVFLEKKDITVPGNPHNISTGDLNKDGRPDIVLANYYLNSVSVLVNKTADNADVPLFSSEISFASGRTPNAAFVISIDNEPYILTANSADKTISILTHNDLNVGRYLDPFWTADTIYDETILPIKTNEGLTEAGLLYKAKKIISIKDGFLQKEYSEGSDWIYADKKIALPAGSSAPYLNDYDLVFNKVKPDSSLPGKAPGTYVLYREGYFQAKQLAVTYIPEDRELVPVPVPAFADKVLVNTISKLKKKENIKIVYYGDSITKGANVSGFLGTSPFMPAWPDLVAFNLQNYYKTSIDAVNLAVGGTMSQWGADNVNQLVVAEKPDLTIIGFGMNDGGTSLVKPEIFKRNIKSIITAIQNADYESEIILISTMVANPASIVDQIQESYKPILDSLAGDGIVVADITALHKELLKHKSYQDMTGNNINHPNDYLARWYAQYISGLLINDGTSDVNQEVEMVPDNYKLYQNYPNPFNPETEIKYCIPEPGLVTIKVFNLLGQEVATLINSEQKPGNHTVRFNAASLASGVYLYRINAGNFMLTKKLVLLK